MFKSRCFCLEETVVIQGSVGNSPTLLKFNHNVLAGLIKRLLNRFEAVFGCQGAGMIWAEESFNVGHHLGEAGGRFGKAICVVVKHSSQLP